MLFYQHEALESWTLPQTRARVRSKFDSTFGQTLDLLARELRYLAARDVRLKTMHRNADVNRDGTLRANARVPEHPGVILTFTADGKQMTFPCDRFSDWQANIRAIALSLEALRLVDRYGVTNKGQQYRGFQALPPASIAMPAMSKGEAFEFLRQHSGIDLTTGSMEAVNRAYKIAATRLHPDAGGKNEDWIMLQEAKKSLA